MNNFTVYFQKIFHLGMSKTARNTYFVFLGNIVSMFFAFLFTVILARAISLSDLGYFSALLSLMLLTSDIADFGIGSSLARFLPTMEQNKKTLLSFLKSAFLFQFFLALFLGLSIFMVSAFISQTLFHTKAFDLLVKVTTLGVIGSILSNFFLYALLARQKFIESSIFTGLGALLRLVFLIILIITSLVSLKNVIWAQSLSLIVLSLVGIFLIKLEFLSVKITRGDLNKLLSFSKYLGIARGLTAVAGKIDVLMIISLANSVEAGIYSLASRVTSIYPLLSGSFSTVLAPKIATLKNTSELKQFFVKVSIATIGLILSIIILIVIAEPFMFYLFGAEKGLPTVSVFRLLLVSMIFFVASIPSVSLAIYYLKKPFILSINSILQLIIVIVGNFILIPKFGREGAAYSLIVAYSVTLVLTSYMSFYYLRKSYG